MLTIAARDFSLRLSAEIAGIVAGTLICAPEIVVVAGEVLVENTSGGKVIGGGMTIGALGGFTGVLVVAFEIIFGGVCIGVFVVGAALEVGGGAVMWVGVTVEVAVDGAFAGAG